MRYLGLFVIILSMSWTWGVINEPSSVSLATHKHLQKEMASIIENYVAQHRPDATPVVFDYLWTETISSTKVKCYFEFGYQDVLEDDEHTEEKRMGWAELSRLSWEQDGDAWSLDTVHIDQDSMVFKEGVVIKPLSEEVQE